MAVRRHLSVLFSDLAEYTQLSERVDPELLSDIQRAYHRIATEAVAEFGGTVASFQGDGVLAYFGYPTAHENDAERAVRSALQIVGRVPAEVQSATGWRPAVRVAVHTGLVVLGPDALGEATVVQGAAGMAVNLAARLQAEAAPDSVVVSQATAALVEGLFVTEALGARVLKGLSRPVALHRVVAARQVSRRSEMRRVRGAGRFVGRADALGQLRAQWAAAAGGQCRVVEIVGEAGIGKTRLAQELCHGLGLAAPHVLQGHCLEIFAATPLYLAGGLLRAALRLDDTDDMPRVRAALAECGLVQDDDVDAACGLLGYAMPGQFAGSAIDLRRRQFEVLTAVVQRVAGLGPTLLWLEDVHWADASSAELAVSIIKRLAGLPLLVVMTRRAVPLPPGLPAAQLRIDLAELAPGEALALARSVPGAATLPPATLAQAVVVAEGVPLFVEQLIFSVISRGAEPADADDLARAGAMPLSLTELLSARLDRLEGGRRIAHAAACVGRAFDTAFLAGLLGSPEAEVQDALEQLIAAEVMQPSVGGGVARYMFTHALLHRVAYESILLSDRRHLHARIVALLGEPGERGASPPEVRAHHLTQAGQTLLAIDAWTEAGTLAAQRSAHLEALEHLQSGLDLLPQVADLAQRDLLELRIHAGRLAPLSATGGATCLRMESCCRRGLELAMAQDGSPLVFVFLYGQCTVMQWRGNAEEAAKLARLFADLSDRRGHRPGRAVAHRLIGLADLARGRSAKARAEMECSLALCDPAEGARGLHLFGQDAHVQSTAALGLVLFCMGETDRACTLNLDAIREAEALQHPHSIAIAIGYFVWSLGLSGARQAMLHHARRLIDVAERHHLGVFRQLGELALGWALCQGGELGAGIAIIEGALAALEAVLFRNPLDGYLAVLADAYRRQGDVGRARALSARAVSLNYNAWLRPEVLRVAALVAPPEQVGRELRAAAAMARALGNPVLEMRCLHSLQGRVEGPERDAAVHRLAELPVPEVLRSRLETIANRNESGHASGAGLQQTV